MRDGSYLAGREAEVVDAVDAVDAEAAWAAWAAVRDAGCGTVEIVGKGNGFDDDDDADDELGPGSELDSGGCC